MASLDKFLKDFFLKVNFEVQTLCRPLKFKCVKSCQLNLVLTFPHIICLKYFHTSLLPKSEFKFLYFFGNQCDSVDPDIPLIFLSKYLGYILDSFLASGNFCRLLIIFANSLDPDQDRHSVGPDLDPNCLTL